MYIAIHLYSSCFLIYKVDLCLLGDYAAWKFIFEAERGRTHDSIEIPNNVDITFCIGKVEYVCSSMFLLSVQ